MSLLEKFLTFWAGADSSFLSLCPRHVRQKYISIGILVLLTASFAFVAASYTFWTIFEEMPISVVLGALWGAFILNLDRFLLTTFPKNATYFRQILHAIPRLVLAVMIGITIAHPIMLRLFMPEIMERIAFDDEKKLALAQNDKVREEGKAQTTHEQQKKLLPQWDELEQRKKDRDIAEAALRECNIEANAAERELKCEFDGGCGTKKKGIGPISRQKEAMWREKKADCQKLLQAASNAEAVQLKAEKSLSQTAIESLQAQMNQIAVDYAATVKRLKRSRAPSFLTRSEALGNLVKDREQVKTTHLGIMLLLVLVEVVPILMKILAPRDSLDELSYATDGSFIRERIPKLAPHLAGHSQPLPPMPSESEYTNATAATGAVNVNAIVQRRIRAAVIIFVTVSIMAWMPSFSLSLDVSVASAALFVSVAPFILALLGETSPHGSGV